MQSKLAAVRSLLSSFIVKESEVLKDQITRRGLGQPVRASTWPGQSQGLCSSPGTSKSHFCTPLALADRQTLLSCPWPSVRQAQEAGLSGPARSPRCPCWHPSFQAVMFQVCLLPERHNGVRAGVASERPLRGSWASSGRLSLPRQTHWSPPMEAEAL